ncbi:MAG TPA: sigma-70 family RNA polymerase sigma factor [Firmicutes bacterium]|nr:sigma-70 family RNA polymerase sigma factor [Bacillota bacterium]
MQIEIRGAERLSFRERQVVALKEMGMSNPQVAKRLGVTQGTVATLYNRAKKKGYQVVIVISGDPLALFDNDDNDDDMNETATVSEND